MKVYYEDKHIIVCLKPVGVLSQGSEIGENMPSVLKELTRSEVYPVHRLDKDVSGVMVFAKTKKAAAELSKQVSEREVEKRYFALTHSGNITASGTMQDFLYFDKRKNKSFVVKKERKGVKEALLEYTLLNESNGKCLYDIKLLTGRTHQIRVQFATRKMPLFGDRRYGAKDDFKHIALFSYSLSFLHPATKEKMTFSEEMPPEFKI